MFDGEIQSQGVFDFDVATAAIKGARDYQEDSILTSFPLGQHYGFAIIADGVGGSAAGHVASALVTTQVFNHLKLQEHLIESGKLNVPFVLEQAAQAARVKIAEHTKRSPETSGMGTTLLIPVIRGDRLSWLSVGDSLLFLLRDGALRQLNQDHSLASHIDMMVKAGSMSEEVGKNHPDRHTLTSIIDSDKINRIDCPEAPIKLKDGDVLIASTDGLQSVPTNVLVQTLTEGHADSSTEMAKNLLEAVRKENKPHQDNTSFVVIKAHAHAAEDALMDIDAMPILAQADGTAETQAPAVEAEPKPERKVYWYRGQKYFRD